MESAEIHIGEMHSYKVYLRTQLGMYIRDEHALDIAVEEMFLAFLDGVKFGRGSLKVTIVKESL